jgi:hypothetical protein
LFWFGFHFCVYRYQLKSCIGISSLALYCELDHWKQTNIITRSVRLTRTSICPYFSIVESTKLFKFSSTVISHILTSIYKIKRHLTSRHFGSPFNNVSEVEIFNRNTYWSVHVWNRSLSIYWQLSRIFWFLARAELPISNYCWNLFAFKI